MLCDFTWSWTCGGNACGNHESEKVNNMADTYHKYAIEWNPDCIKWFIDDQLYVTATPYELHRQKGNKHWTLMIDHFILY